MKTMTRVAVEVTANSAVVHHRGKSGTAPITIHTTTAANTPIEAFEWGVAAPRRCVHRLRRGGGRVSSPNGRSSPTFASFASRVTERPAQVYDRRRPGDASGSGCGRTGAEAVGRGLPGIGLVPRPVGLLGQLRGVEDEVIAAEVADRCDGLGRHR